MEVVSRRDYFAASADVTCLNTASIEYAAARANVNLPPDNPTPNQLANFWNKVEFKWRWKYADLMLKGSDSVNGG